MVGTLATISGFIALTICLAVGVFADSTILGICAGAFVFFPLLLLSFWLDSISPSSKKRSRINFYKKCIEQKIVDLSLPANRKKAELIATEEKLPFPDGIEKLLAECKALYDEQNKEELAAKNRAELAALHVEEQKTYNILSKYANLVGREKRIRILTDLQASYRKKAKELDDLARGAIHSSQQKEYDWAILGGIASGIAGGAAGAATAINYQAKNESIRAQNYANMQAMLPLVTSSWSKASSFRSAADKLQPIIEDAKIKLVADTSKDELLPLLEIREQAVTISKTGSFSVKATIKLREPLTIYETVNAVIDGTISANLFQNNQKVGSALLVLPQNGVSTQAINIEGISLYRPELSSLRAEQNVPYEVKFTAYRLWAMEA